MTQNYDRRDFIDDEPKAKGRVHNLGFNAVCGRCAEDEQVDGVRNITEARKKASEWGYVMVPKYGLVCSKCLQILKSKGIGRSRRRIWNG